MDRNLLTARSLASRVLGSFVIGHTRPGLVVTTFIGMMLLLVGALLGLMAGGANKAEARRAHEAIALHFSILSDELARLISDYAVWDEAMKNLVEEPDIQWADMNVGSYLTKHYDVSATYVLAPTGGIVMAFLDGQPANAGDIPFTKNDFAPLLAAVPETSAEPLAVGTILTSGGQAYLTYASRIAGFTPEAKLRPASGTHYAVFQRRLDGAVLEKLRQGASVVAVRISLNEQDRRAQTDGFLAKVWGAPIQTIALPSLGVPSAVQIEATPLRPGLTILVDMLIPLALLALGIGGCGALLVHAVSQMQSQQTELKSAREAAEQANRGKSRFLASASHDLRQPMQSLLLFLEVLKPDVSPNGQEALKHLGRGLDALSELLNSLLDISRLDAAIVEPSIEDFAIDQLVELIGADYTPIAAAKGLRFQISHCAATVRTDRTLLGRMVRNLVENALRYTETGGIAVACHAAEGHLRLDVRDTGIGIPPEHQERIWEEFHQVDNPERDRNRGLGLGLAIVQRLSVLLEHPVTVRSAPGQGSVFSILLPLGRAGAPEVSAVANDKPSNARLVLLMDDDAIVLLGLKAIFEEWGYEVLAAGSADQALDALKKDGRRADIVVADYRLRGRRKGIEAILRVREACGTNIPGIILTGETGTEAEKDAAEHGLALIHKPVTPRQLSEALN